MDNNLKKSDESKVKVFIQGSADITGQNSFSGKLNEQYPFDKISVLPPNFCRGRVVDSILFLLQPDQKISSSSCK